MIFTLDDLQLINKLMPFSPGLEDEEIEETDLSYRSGLLVILDALPEVYMAGMLATQDGKDPNQIILAKLNEMGFVLDSIAQTGYGIRIEAKGSGFSRPDLLEEYSDGYLVGEYEVARYIWTAMGAVNQVVPEATGKVLSSVIERILGRYDTRFLSDDPEGLSRLQRFGWFLAWVFSDTGEFYLDSLDEEAGEMGYYSEWCKNEIEDALGVIAYRDMLWKVIEQGMELFLLHKDAIIESLRNEDVQECLTKLVSCLNCDASEPAPLSEATEMMA